MTSPSPSIADRICAAVMLGLCALVLLDQVLGQDWAGQASRGVGLALLIVVMPRFGLREWVLLAIAVALTVGLALRPGGWGEAGAALERGAFFSSFILMMMLLREAAITSASVLEVGAWITRQPAGRRFMTTWLGANIAGILLNFGAVSLLAPLIQRGVRDGVPETPEGRERVALLERRQLSALIRGFSPIICWAPTTLTQVIILSSVPGLDPGRAMAMGLGFSAIMLILARAEDLVRWGRPKRVGAPPPFPRRAGLDLLAVYLLLVGGALIVQWLVHGSLPLALMTVAPMMLIGWVITQGRTGTLPEGARARLTEIALVSVPRAARDAYLLGSAGFIGIAAGHLAPVGQIAVMLEAAHMPGWVIVAALPVVITLGGQVALSPMVMVVFLAAVVASLPALPAAPEYIALALGAGWALSTTAAPNSTGAILVSAGTGVPATTITWRWNGVYSLTVLAAFAVLAWVMVG